MRIKSVLFNTDTAKSINTALNLRFDYKIPLSFPEYDITIGNNAEICYVSDKVNSDLEIEVNIDEFPHDLENQWITIKAQSSANADTILGDSEEKLIGITGQSIQGGTFKLKFSKNKIAENNIGKFYCILDWKYKAQDSTDWIEIQSTGHTIYTIPHVPLNSPWSVNDMTSRSTPWVTALDYICSYFGSGKGILQDNKICDETAKYINNYFFTYTGDSSYSSFNLNSTPKKTIFNPALFISDMAKASSNNLLKVNCNDCASINSFFLSLLGIKINILYLSDTYPFTKGFTCNEIISIGGSDWAVPFKSSAVPGVFRYHAVCSSTGTPAPAITDSCLKIDSGIDPWTIPAAADTKEALLPSGMDFADPATVPPNKMPAPPYAGKFYRERLCTQAPTGIESCCITAQTDILEFDMSLKADMLLRLNTNHIPDNALIKYGLQKKTCNNNLMLYNNYTLNEYHRDRAYISADKLSFTDTLYLNESKESQLEISHYCCRSYKDAITLLNNYLETSSCFYVSTDRLNDITDIALISGKEKEDFLTFVKGNVVIFITLNDNCSSDIFEIAETIINEIK
ncbi:MAG: hypothetical protein Q4D26_06530 [Clostridia bacterium]|nr:hypothetical protein [Clostridia bacterium]